MHGVRARAKTCCSRVIVQQVPAPGSPVPAPGSPVPALALPACWGGQDGIHKQRRRLLSAAETPLYLIRVRLFLHLFPVADLGP